MNLCMSTWTALKLIYVVKPSILSVQNCFEDVREDKDIRMEAACNVSLSPLRDCMLWVFFTGIYMKFLNWEIGS
mgnify:FL=1